MSIRDGFNIDGDINLNNNINIIYNRIENVKLFLKNIDNLSSIEKFKLFFICLGIFIIFIITPLFYHLNVRPASILFCFILGLVDILTSQIISSDYLRTESKVDMEF